ncbi:MAG: DNA replication/repair protein RecF [Pyrinomonadaceae bacterium]
MLLASIEATNFRNLSGKISWGPQLNIIYGNNGQGKTNWLEAIHVLARTKSFRTQRLQETIRFGEDQAVINGIVKCGSDIQRELQVSLQGTTKSIAVNNKREVLTRYLTHLAVFTFTALDLDVVRGMPEARRRFLDRGVASLKPSYLRDLADYNKVIKHKNKILESALDENRDRDTIRDLLAPWNDQLVPLAWRIHSARENYVKDLNRALEHQLFDRRHLTTRYISSLEGKGDINDYEGLFRSRLMLRQEAELKSGHCLIGPHRDEWKILLDAREIRIFGSSGQQRSALLLLDLAAISLYNLALNENPIFIIDDVDAELDERRIKRLLEYLENRTQTFITTSKRSHVQGFISRANTYEIEDGRVRGTQSQLDATAMHKAPSY